VARRLLFSASGYTESEMKGLCLSGALWLASSLLAQTQCPPTPIYTPCEILIELTSEEMQVHPNPYQSVTIDVEFRSPRYRTLRLPAFWDGGNRMVVRFAPTEPGQWDYRITSNLPRVAGMTGSLQATAADSPGFVRVRNVHHWGHTETDAPHLWMGATSLRFAFLDASEFGRLLSLLRQSKFNHLRGLAVGGIEDAPRVFPGGKPDPEFFRALDQRVRALNEAGIVADLILAGGGNHLSKLFPSAADRERYLRFMVGRYAALHVTWLLVESFEDYDNGRMLLRETGTLLRKLDPYDHPRSTGAAVTSSPLLADGWMSYIVHNSADAQLGSIEHQLYPVPFVNTAVGATSGAAPDASTLLSHLWNATMNGQYPTLSEASLPLLSGEGGKIAANWVEFFAQTRYWDLEPYFDVDGGRAVALEIPEDEEMRGIEYIVYAEKPGAVEAVVQKHSYDVSWYNPRTGERRKQKQFRGDRVKLTAPDSSQPWVLHISREAEKQRMLRRYKFESRRPLMQEVEQNVQRIPFEIAQPDQPALPLDAPVAYQAKVTRETRATRSMMWLWTGEVSVEQQGFRVLGTGAEGQMRIPSGMARQTPAVMNLRLTGMNANGKVYFLDRIYRLTR
jgi:hypothetical protein